MYTQKVSVNQLSVVVNYSKYEAGKDVYLVVYKNYAS